MQEGPGRVHRGLGRATPAMLPPLTSIKRSEKGGLAVSRGRGQGATCTCSWCPVLLLPGMPRSMARQGLWCPWADVGKGRGRAAALQLQGFGFQSGGAGKLRILPAQNPKHRSRPIHRAPGSRTPPAALSSAGPARPCAHRPSAARVTSNTAAFSLVALNIQSFVLPPWPLTCM